MPVPVLDLPQMRQWEQATWATGVTEQAVIARVGELVARRALELTAPGDRLLILAGKGHNGDDARCATPHLGSREVECVNVFEPAEVLAEVLAALARRPALIIDGLFGIGLNRPLDPAWTHLLEQINLSQIPILAVDVPSGLDAGGGGVFGAALRAEVTFTLGAPKAGLVRPAAWPFVGRLEVAPEIGLVSCPASGELLWTLPADFRGFPPRRPSASHKGAYGHLAIVAGSTGYHGAAVLTARGAQRAQPGLVSLFTPASVYGVVAAQLQAVMVHPWEPDRPWPAGTSALLFGPGLAAPELPAGLRERLAEAWRQSPLPVVADASGLNLLSPGPAPAGALRVITPHPGEAGRLLGIPTEEVQADRPAAVRALSRRFGDCWVVLKGHQTLVGRAEGELYLNGSGNPWLAQGGSGDLLAGFLAGWLAQPPLRPHTLTALRYAVWQHGASADHLAARQRNWTVEDLAAVLGEVRAAD